MATIVLIRHGSTSWNKEGRAQGNSDIPLDQDGINQAERLAKRLSSEKWNHIYSSPLARAKQTASIIGRTLDININLDDALEKDQAV